MIRIYDGNNYTRRILETDPTGQAPRTIFNTLSSQMSELAFYVWDALDGNTARRKIYPAYKSKRPELSGDVFANFDMVQSVLLHSPAIQVQLPGYEADDVIAALTRHYAAQGKKVHIHSTDRDFLQLSSEAPDLVSCDSALKEGVLLKYVRHHKTLVGDASDTIPGIAGFGAGAWDTCDQAAVAAWLEALVAGEPLPSIEFKKAVSNWVSIPENRQLLIDYWNIIGFIPVSQEQIISRMAVGSFNIEAAETIFKKYML